MIDFACKKFDIEEVVKCSLGFSKSEFKLLKFLMEQDSQFTTDELSKKLNLDKSTIQRAVKKMHEKGILFRGQRNQSVGGYVFLYKIKSKQNVRKIILDTVEKWVGVFREKIEKW